MRTGWSCRSSRTPTDSASTASTGQIRDLADRSRGQKLRLEDIQGGTFTLDNTGWTGSIITQPIINAPEVGIMTMESIVKRPVVVETAER